MCSVVLVNMDTIKVEDEPGGLRACRICLAWDLKLHNISELGLERTFSELIGTTLSLSEGFPQQICGFCRAQLVKAQALRERCQRADQVLKQAIEQQQFITNEYIHTIDRTAHKLTHTLTQVCLKDCDRFYCGQEDTQTNVDQLCSKVKDEVEPSADENGVVNEDNSQTEILQVVIIENETEAFEMNCDDSDEETKDNIIVNDSKLAGVKIVEANLKRIGVKRGRLKEVKKETIKDKIGLNRQAKRKNKKETAIDSKTSVRAAKLDVNEKDNSEPARFFTIEEIEEFIKKYNFEIQHLTDEQMVEDMEKRKVSDRYKHCKYKCSLCYQGFLTTTTFDKHMTKDHDPRNAKNECRLCRVSYRYGFYLRQHMQNAHRLRLRCAECGAVVWGRKECVAHAARHAGATRQCKHCGKHFLKKSSYTWHMRAAHPVENVASGSCELCGEIYTSPKGLRAHKLLVHNKPAASELQCRRCRAQFDNKDALRSHQRQLVDKKCDPNSSPCSVCGAACAGAEPLLRHLHETHRVDIFTCDLCNKSFLSKPSLSTHIDRVHLGIRPLQHHQAKLKQAPRPARRAQRRHDHMCETCGKAYTTHQFLKNHQMSHTGERPYKCDRCPKGFITAMQLTWHTRTHTGERPFQCDQCQQAFSLECNLRRHRKAVHLGFRKNVPCARCDKTFSSNSTMKLHVRTVHDGVPWPRRVRNRRPDRPCTLTTRP